MISGSRERNKMEEKNLSVKDINLLEEKSLQCLSKHIPPTPNFLLDVYRDTNQLREMYSDLNVDLVIGFFRCCGHKIQSIKYHLDNYLMWEKRYIKNFKEALKCIPIKNLTIGSETPNLIFEYESFIIQFKACLDIYSQAVGRLFKQNPSDICGLKNVLEGNNSNQKAKRILELIRKNKEWLDEFKSRQDFKSDRDKVTHYSVVNLGTLNVNKKNNKFRVIIHLKKKDMILKNYLGERLKNLELFIQETTTLIRK